MKKWKIIIIIVLVILLIPLSINLYVILSTKDLIKNVDDIKEKYDIVMVLGCGVKNNKPSLMLQDRLDKAILLYEQEKVQKILITGDENDKEVTIMLNYLISHDIPENVIIQDEVGYSTSISMQNFKNNFTKEKIIVVTQKYHMYRSLFLAQKMQINAIGVPAKSKAYPGDLYREVREILARIKDFFKTLF